MALPLKIAVIVLGRNGQEYLPDCLSSLLKQNCSFVACQIMVVDNGSSDGSVEFVEQNYPAVFLIKNATNLGFAAGNNIGMKWALENNFDYIVLLNQDTVVDPAWLSELVKIAESDQRIGAIQARLMLYSKKDEVNSLGNAIHFLGFGFSAGGYQKFDNNSEPKEITYPSGAAVLFRAQVLREVGLFNPDFFMYHEDLDLGWRVRLAGYKIFLAPKAVVYHKYEFSRSMKKYYYMERNRYITILQNYRWPTILVIVPALILMELGMFFYSLITGWWKEKLKVYGYFLHPRSWSKIMAERREVAKIRKIKDKEIVKYFVGKIEFQEIDNPVLKYIVNPVFSAYWWIIRKLIFW